MSATSLDGGWLAPPVHRGIELRQTSSEALEAILDGRVPAFPGLAVGDGAMPPLHVAERALRLARAGCPLEWAYPFNIIDLSHEVIVGGCGFKGAPSDGIVEIGYGVAGLSQRRGFATYAVQTLVRAATASGLVKQVVAHIVPGNVASETVAGRSGFAPGVLITDPLGELVRCWHHRVVT